MNESKSGIITLGLDKSERGLIDIVSGYQPDDWHPANGCSNRLIKCKEALQDIYEILDSYSLVDEVDRRKRKITASSTNY